MDTSRRDMLLASLLATLPAMVVSEAVASPINRAQTIIQPPADHHWVSNKNYRSAAWICVRWQAHLPSRGYI